MSFCNVLCGSPAHSGYSMRIYPHLQDTGGFFVAVLQRKTVAKDGDSVVNPVYVLTLFWGRFRS
jgi:hypothetical protein